MGFTMESLLARRHPFLSVVLIRKGRRDRVAT